jgi:hypothetical protein
MAPLAELLLSVYFCQSAQDRMALFKVRALVGNKMKVRNAGVVFSSEMVNYFGRFKASTNRMLHNKPMDLNSGATFPVAPKINGGGSR